MTVPARQTKAIGDIEDIYDSAAEQEALAIILEPRYLSMLNAVHELVRTTFPEMEDFRLDDSATRHILRLAADDVVRIDDTTKAAVRAMLQRGQELGLSNWELANGSPKDGFPGIEGLFRETWRGRAELIARNELAIAQIEASQERYRASGLVDRLQLRDGTGPKPDQPCINRNGQVVPLSSRPQQLHVQCLTGDQIVLAPNLRKTFTRWFDGEVVVISTSDNDQLTCTPNHPILTPRGWVAAGLLHEGNDVLRCTDSQRLAVTLDSNTDQRPTRIEDVARSFRPDHAATAQPITAEDFHGDASDGDVCAIRSDSLLWDGSRREHGEQVALTLALMRDVVFPSQGTRTRLLKRWVRSEDGGMSARSDLPSFVSGHASHAHSGSIVARTSKPVFLQPDTHSFGVHVEYPSDVDRTQLLVNVERPDDINARIETARGVVASCAELTVKSGSTDSSDGSDIADALGSLVERVQIVESRHVNFAGQVFNLQTDQGWYIAGNFITHNCTLVCIPVLRGDPDPAESNVPPVARRP